MSATMFTEQASAPSTPASSKCKLYFDNTANPQLKFVDDSGASIQIVDSRNTVTMTNKTLTSPTINAYTMTGTGTIAAGCTLTSPTLVTPAIGVATGTSLAATGALTSSSPTAKIGYVTGAGGTGTQSSTKATAVTMSPAGVRTGQITMNNAALLAGTIVSFVVNNTSVLTGDIVNIQHDSGGTLGAYTVLGNTIVNATSFQVTIRNNTGGSLSEALVLKFELRPTVNS